MSLSVRQAFACLGRNGGSVLRDLFGYPELPKRVSVAAQCRALRGRHYHINVIRVAPEDMFAGHVKQICNALQVAREMFGTVEFGIGRVAWFDIPANIAGTYAVIDSSAEASDLTEAYSVPNDGLDLFVVRTIIGADGWSVIDGSCDKNKKNSMTGCVVEIFEGKDAYAANGFAHEMGHYLGLDHVPDSGNFLGGDGASDSWTGITEEQGAVMKAHCLVRSGC